MRSSLPIALLPPMLSWLRFVMMMINSYTTFITSYTCISHTYHPSYSGVLQLKDLNAKLDATMPRHRTLNQLQQSDIKAIILRLHIMLIFAALYCYYIQVQSEQIAHYDQYARPWIILPRHFYIYTFSSSVSIPLDCLNLAGIDQLSIIS